MLPRIRLQQFSDAPEWSIDKFGNLIVPVEERAGTIKYTPMSVTSGVGLIPQIEKFGREIAGSAYKNYYVIKKNDFAYNKSATKQFPEGYISMLTEYEEAALPNSIFTCFRIIDKECDPRFFDHLFHNNYHGSWLRKYIEVGSRAHGSLSVKTQHLWAMPIALPRLEEQQKIADCLSLLDDLINAEVKKLRFLKAHKKGLMQRMFPAEGKTIPELRFPEFKNNTSWKKCILADVLKEHKCKSTGSEEVFSVSVRKGLVNQIEHLGRSFSASSTNHYNRVFPGDVVYTKSPTGNFPLGIIKQSKLDFSVIVSPLYGVFTPETIAIGTMLDSYFESPENIKAFLDPLAQKGAKNTININNSRFLSGSLILPTNKYEQQKIADCLSPLDDYIIAQSDKIEALKTHKKGLMQGLFPSVEEVDR